MWLLAAARHVAVLDPAFADGEPRTGRLPRTRRNAGPGLRGEELLGFRAAGRASQDYCDPRRMRSCPFVGNGQRSDARSRFPSGSLHPGGDPRPRVRRRRGARWSSRAPTSARPTWSRFALERVVASLPEYVSADLPRPQRKRATTPARANRLAAARIRRRSESRSSWLPTTINVPDYGPGARRAGGPRRTGSSVVTRRRGHEQHAFSQVAPWTIGHHNAWPVRPSALRPSAAAPRRARSIRLEDLYSLLRARVRRRSWCS